MATITNAVGASIQGLARSDRTPPRPTVTASMGAAQQMTANKAAPPITNVSPSLALFRDDVLVLLMRLLQGPYGGSLSKD